ncbi:flagellar FliJ family protein [Azospirillum halopraeferens]|uniref:flagellar FliJ family protein n=1 Tax=Azospirillum halopraeferens TaxID=34010 RepID=UPI000411D884|nr:flagellar FliJ family protein [Azospirillum halopraeferens]
MNSLKTVIRLHKWQLDEKRRALADLQSLGDRLRGEAEKLEQEILHEQRTALEHGEVAFGYASFARAARERQQRLAQSIREVERQIAAATEVMAEAFQELKRYELAEEERQRRETEKLKRREAALLDETALVGYRRRQQRDQESGTGL